MKHNIDVVKEKLKEAKKTFEQKKEWFKSEHYRKLARDKIVAPPYDFGWWLGYLDGLRWLLHNKPRKKLLREQYHGQWPDIPKEHIKDDDDWKARKLKNCGYKQGYGHALKWETSAYVTPLWRDS